MSVQTAMVDGRAMATRILTDSCTITRQEGDPQFDDDTGKYTYPDPTTVYQGRCRIQIRTEAVESSAGERTNLVQSSELQLPVTDDTDTIVPGDVAEITDSPWSAALVGRKFTVSDRFDKSHSVMRRLQVQEVVG